MHTRSSDVQRQEKMDTAVQEERAKYFLLGVALRP
jgi:hypothetical protein